MSTPNSPYHYYHHPRFFEGSRGQQRRGASGIGRNTTNSTYDDTGYATASTLLGSSVASTNPAMLMMTGNSCSGGSSAHHDHEAQLRAVQRLNQVKDEQCHHDIVQQKNKDLLASKMDVLRSYVQDVIEADNWKYEPRNWKLAL
jgi:hypothetical protein